MLWLSPKSPATLQESVLGKKKWLNDFETLLLPLSMSIITALVARGPQRVVRWCTEVFQRYVLRMLKLLCLISICLHPFKVLASIGIWIILSTYCALISFPFFYLRRGEQSYKDYEIWSGWTKKNHLFFQINVTFSLAENIFYFAVYLPVFSEIYFKRRIENYWFSADIFLVNSEIYS